jgi:hypothetical protein
MQVRLEFLAHLATDCRPVQLWNNPVQQGETWPIRPAQVRSGQPPVLNGDDFVSGALQSRLQKAAGEHVVVCYENHRG